MTSIEVDKVLEPIARVQPTTDKGEQTRTRVIRAASQLFREAGFAATTMRQVASRAGVVKSATYYYFPSKEAIAQACNELARSEHASH